MAYPDMVGYVAKDLEATLAFYRLIGLDVPTDYEIDEKGRGHVEVITPNGYRLAWDTVPVAKEMDAHWQAGTGNIRIAFRCDSPAEVDALFDKVVAAGYKSERAPFDAIWGQRYASVYDPDGNVADLFAPLS
jgi:uncharacterized glyoxalase superfamily protein PhnB